MRQAGSLCSPEKSFAVSSLTQFLRRFRHIGSLRSIAILALHVFEL
jgi:hypothetical protein